MLKKAQINVVFSEDCVFCPTIIKAMPDMIWQYICLIKLQADVGSIKCIINAEALCVGRSY